MMSFEVESDSEHSDSESDDDGDGNDGQGDVGNCQGVQNDLIWKIIS